MVSSFKDVSSQPSQRFMAEKNQFLMERRYIFIIMRQNRGLLATLTALILSCLSKIGIFKISVYNRYLKYPQMNQCQNEKLVK